MNILFYQFGINPLKGGVQRVSYNIAKQLKLQGDKVYAVYKDDDAFTENLRNAFEDCLKINSLDDSAFIKLVKFSRTCKVNIIINQCGFSISDTKFLSKLKKNVISDYIHLSIYLRPAAAMYYNSEISDFLSWYYDHWQRNLCSFFTRLINGNTNAFINCPTKSYYCQNLL